MKRYFAVGLSFLLMAGLAACGNVAPSAEAPRTEESAAPAEAAEEEEVQAAEAAEETAPAEEETPEEAEPQAADEADAVNSLAVKAPGFTGLTNLIAENNEDGSYFYEDLTEDGITVITNMCAAAAISEDTDPETRISGFLSEKVHPEYRVTDVRPDEDLSAALSYPAYKVSFESGENEDSRQGIGAVILTDAFTYYYGFSCPVDFFEENEEFYLGELAGTELIDLAGGAASADEQIDGLGNIADSLTAGDGEEGLTEDTSDIGEEAGNPGGEKGEADPELMARAAELDSHTDFSEKDVAGFWKYDAYDEIYLALYEVGNYEIYEIESGDISSDGTFSVDGTSVELTENGSGDVQYLQIVSSVRLSDDEGDTLSPYLPESMMTASGDPDDPSRSYGAPGYDDLTVVDAGKGMYGTRSQSRFAQIIYPYNYYVGADGDFLYAYDGDIAYATVRNITNDFHNWNGTARDFVDNVGAGYLVEDFEYFYGPMEYSGDVSRTYNPKESQVSCLRANIWNSHYDINCVQVIYISTFSDGTEYLMMMNRFYRYGDNNSYERIFKVKSSGYR